MQAHAHADYDVRNSLASFLLHARPMGFFSGPDAWAIEQGPGTEASATGLDDVVRRWPPEFDRPLGPPTTNATCTNATLTGSPSVCTRKFSSGAEVIWNATAGQGTIKWADGNITQGPECHPERHTWPGDTNHDRMCASHAMSTAPCLSGNMLQLISLCLDPFRGRGVRFGSGA